MPTTQAPANFIAEVLSSFSCRFVPPRALESAGRGCGSLSDSLAVCRCPGPVQPRLGMPGMSSSPAVPGVQPWHEGTSLQASRSARCCYSRRAATPSTAESPARRESQAHSCSGIALLPEPPARQNTLYFLTLGAAACETGARTT